MSSNSLVVLDKSMEALIEKSICEIVSSNVLDETIIRKILSDNLQRSQVVLNPNYKKLFTIEYYVIIDPSKTDNIDNLISGIKEEMLINMDDMPTNVGNLFGDELVEIGWKNLNRPD
jgi:hypothetical protein